MACYHLDSGAARINRLYARQDVQVQFMSSKWKSKLSGLRRVTAMSDLIQHLERMKNAKMGETFGKSSDSQPEKNTCSPGAYWLDFCLFKSG